MRKKLDLKAALTAIEDHEPKRFTVQELVDLYVLHTPASSARYQLARWLEALGDMDAWAVTTDQLQAIGDAMVQAGYRHGHINRCGSMLGSVYKWAARMRYTPKNFHSPTVGIQRGKEDMRRVEHKPDIVKALRAGSMGHRDQRFALLVNLMLDSGARPGEILRRRWGHVDLDNGEMLIPAEESKTKKARFLYFRAETGKLLRRLKPHNVDPNEFLFKNRRGGTHNYRHAWTNLRNLVGVPDFVPYDCRHVAAANLLRNGSTIAVASQVLGNSSLILHQRYGHLENQALKEAQQATWTKQSATTLVPDDPMPADCQSAI